MFYFVLEVTFSSLIFFEIHGYHKGFIIILWAHIVRLHWIDNFLPLLQFFCFSFLNSMFIKVSFLLREIFRGNLNEAISLIEIEVTFKVISISAIEITLACWGALYQQKETVIIQCRTYVEPPPEAFSMYFSGRPF